MRYIVYLHYFLPDTSAGRRGRPEPPFGYEWGGGGQTLRSELSPCRSLPYFPAQSKICSPFLRRSILPYPQLNPVETSVETCIEQIKPISITLLLLIIIYTVSNVATVSTIFYNFFQHSLWTKKSKIFVYLFSMETVESVETSAPLLLFLMSPSAGDNDTTFEDSIQPRIWIIRHCVEDISGFFRIIKF